MRTHDTRGIFSVHSGRQRDPEIEVDTAESATHAIKRRGINIQRSTVEDVWNVHCIADQQMITSAAQKLLDDSIAPYNWPTDATLKANINSAFSK
ncbi:unnamed protein product [Wuchereria bancrofti]|uniref:Uncharacterized protein n=1 Tax=Wuchereria bancrofti TaxID=6293 RepID=A0A3P7G5C2_WUCBA|nr:unnamed protein product [Wuchereria bancrofti]